MGVADDNEVALIPVEVEVDGAEVGFGDTDEGGFVTLVLVNEVAVGDEFGAAYARRGHYDPPRPG